MEATFNYAAGVPKWVLFLKRELC